ncbi:hypothetical protein ES703_27117 [subsurface metagenome]
MLKSSAFENNGVIPKKYTIDGDKVSPPLVWSDLTPETKSYALLMEDLDVPEAMGGVFIHWMVYDIPEGVRAFEEGKLPEGFYESCKRQSDSGTISHRHLWTRRDTFAGMSAPKAKICLTMRW